MPEDFILICSRYQSNFKNEGGVTANENCNHFPTGRPGGKVQRKDSIVILNNWRYRKFPTLWTEALHWRFRAKIQLFFVSQYRVASGRDRSLFGRFNQFTVYFQINFQAFGCIFGLADVIEGAGDNTVAIAL